MAILADPSRPVSWTPSVRVGATGRRDPGNRGVVLRRRAAGSRAERASSLSARCRPWKITSSVALPYSLEAVRDAPCSPAVTPPRGRARTPPTAARTWRRPSAAPGRTPTFQEGSGAFAWLRRTGFSGATARHPDPSGPAPVSCRGPVGKGGGIGVRLRRAGRGVSASPTPRAARSRRFGQKSVPWLIVYQKPSRSRMRPDCLLINGVSGAPRGLKSKGWPRAGMGEFMPVSSAGGPGRNLWKNLRGPPAAPGRRLSGGPFAPAAKGARPVPG